MHFVYQPLTWGFLLVLLPLLIHLINMMRHRRVRWAAMDFLLQAYKKHRKWIWLKQLILLLMRMAAVALIVAMLAQWVTQSQWLDIFGGKPTHYYVLVDDSFSMADRRAGANAFEAGLAAVQRIGSQAAAESRKGPQKFTLIRYSRAARAAALPEEDQDYNQIADFNAEIVDSGFDVTLEEKRNEFHVTELSSGPLPALTLLRELIELSTDENRLVYVVSDFRNSQWENPSELRDVLRSIEQSPAQVELVGCVRETSQNLALVYVQPTNETRAAGVPLFVNIRVRNFGLNPARNVQLNVNTLFYAPEMQQAASPDTLQPQVEAMPTVLIEEIEPGQIVERRVQVFYPKPGRHVVEAYLPDDTVAQDNRRWCVIDFPDGEPVLIIDGSVEQRQAYFLESVFQPGGRATTGVVPDVKPPAYLRDLPPEVLAQYRSVYLLDVPRLDDRAVDALEAYVRSGGGVAIFVGPNVDRGFYNNRLHRGGQGLLPAPLGREDFLVEEEEENLPDLEPTEHPVFQVFLGERNPFIRLITIEQFIQPEEGWKPPEESSVEIASLLRNGSPLAVSQKFGDGQVFEFLSTLAPDWNNWGNDPSFVVMILKLQSFLASSQRSLEPIAVGAELQVAVETEKYQPEILFVTPGETPETRLVIEHEAKQPSADSPVWQSSIGGGVINGSGDTDRSGIYEAWAITLGGEADVRRYAVNVDPHEGDLVLTETKTLLEQLDPVKLEFRYADEYTFDTASLSGDNRSLLLMALLILLLIAEQIMAYSASYHPVRLPAAAG